jgi:hypothetical protein
MIKRGNGKVEGPTNSPDQLNRIVEGTRIKGEVTGKLKEKFHATMLI